MFVRIHIHSHKSNIVDFLNSFSQFLYIVRKRINLNQSEALFLFVNNKLVPSNKSIFDVYDKEQDKDGFLYIIYNNENTFG